MKIDISGLGKTVTKFVGKNSPTILTAVGVVGFISTVVLVAKDSPKAKLIIDEKKKIAEENDEKYTKVDAVKDTWKVYIPAAATGTFAIACVLGGNISAMKRNVALATALQVSQTAYDEYRAKTKEVLGEKKEKHDISDAIAKDHVDANPPKKEEIFATGCGMTLCYDEVSGRYFYSDRESVRSAFNTINERLWSEMFMSLNELYYELKIPRIKLGDNLGFNVDDGCVEPIFSPILSVNGEPCLAISYDVHTRFDLKDEAVAIGW